MAEIGKLFVTIGSTLDSKGFKNAAQEIRKVGIAAGLMGAAVIAAAVKVAKAAGDQEAAEKTLAAAMKQAGTYTEAALKHSIEYASALQSMTRYGDEAILSVQKMLTNFGIEGEMLDKLTKATLDLAAAKGMDLVAASDLVAKSVGSTTNALTRYGISVTGAAGSTGRAQEAVENITKLFGGAAKAEAETYLGRIDQMTNQWGDLQEKIGAVVIPIIERLMDWIRKAIAQISSWMETNKELTTTIITLVVALGAVLAGIAPLLIAFPTLIGLLGKALSATRLLWAAMAGHPLVAITAAVAGLTLAMAAYLEKQIDSKNANIELGKTTQSLINIQKKEMESLKEIATNIKTNDNDRKIALDRYMLLRKSVSMLEGQLAREEEARQKAIADATAASVKVRRDYVTEWMAEKRFMDEEYLAWQREQDALRMEEWINDKVMKLETAAQFFTQLSTTAQAFGNLQTTRIQNETTEAIDSENQKYNERRNFILKNVTDESERDRQLAQLETTHAARIENLQKEGERRVADARRRLKPYLIAEALANTALGATKSMAQFGWPLGAVMAALATAAGLAQVATIKAQQFAKGGMVEQGTLGIMGEAGQEVALPLKHPNTIEALSGALRSAFAATGGMGGMNVYVTVPAITSRQVANQYGELIGDRIIQKVKRNRKI